MDYAKIIDRFKKVFEGNGAVEENDYPYFAPADKEQLTYLIDLYGTFNYWTQVYLDNELETLKEYKVPQVVVDFYAQYEPKDIPMTNAGIYLLDLEAIKDENSSDAGGGVLLKYGLITIATTIGGDLVCIDLNDMKNNDPKVVIIEHWSCCSVDSVENYEDVQEIEHLISETFSEFLWKLSGDEYEDFEDTYLNED